MSTLWSSPRRMFGNGTDEGFAHRAAVAVRVVLAAVLAADDRRSSGRGRGAPPKGGEKTMGQKINPIGLRLGINRTWDSCWFAGKNYMRSSSTRTSPHPRSADEGTEAGRCRAHRDRAPAQEVLRRSTRRVRASIGKKGADIDKLKKKVAEITDLDVVINIIERKPELDATGCRADRAAARAPRCVPPRHEARRFVGDASGR